MHPSAVGCPCPALRASVVAGSGNDRTEAAAAQAEGLACASVEPDTAVLVLAVASRSPCLGNARLSQDLLADFGVAFGVPAVVLAVLDVSLVELVRRDALAVADLHHFLPELQERVGVLAVLAGTVARTPGSA